MRIVECDRCGKQREAQVKKEPCVLIILNKVDPSVTPQGNLVKEKDLCSPCFDQLKTWFNRLPQSK